MGWLRKNETGGRGGEVTIFTRRREEVGEVWSEEGLKLKRGWRGLKKGKNGGVTRDDLKVEGIKSSVSSNPLFPPSDLYLHA